MGDKLFKERSFEWFGRKVRLSDNGPNPKHMDPKDVAMEECEPYQHNHVQ